MADDDAEDQSNELVALQSIYGEDSICVNEPLCGACGEGSIPTHLSYSVLVTVDFSDERATVRVDRRNCCQPVCDEDEELAPATNDDDDRESNNNQLARDPRQLVNQQVATTGLAAAPPLARTPSALAASVSHLPPLTLSIVCPSDYPSAQPPRFALACAWLGPAHLRDLGALLDRVWSNECGVGSTCVYHWVEALRQETIATLRLRTTDGAISITLEDGGTGTGGNGSTHTAGGGGGCVEEDEGEASAADGGAAAADTLAELVRYDWEEEQRAWCARVLTCPICLEEQSGDLCVRGMGGACAHAACKACLRAMVDAATTSGDPGSLKCVHVDCRAPMPAAIVAQVASSDAAFDRWSAQKRERLLLTLPGICYCPRCDPASADYRSRRGGNRRKDELCKFWAQGKCLKAGDCKFAHGEAELAPVPVAVPCLPADDTDDLCVCPECEYSFCAACLEAYHPGYAQHARPGLPLLDRPPASSRIPRVRARVSLLTHDRPALVCLTGPRPPTHRCDARNRRECVAPEARAAFLESRAKLMQEAHASGGGGDGKGGKSAQAAARQAMDAARARLEELKSLEMIKRTSKACPSCKGAIERIAGCNHMRCGFCGAHFCWNCNQLVPTQRLQPTSNTPSNPMFLACAANPAVLEPLVWTDSRGEPVRPLSKRWLPRLPRRGRPRPTTGPRRAAGGGTRGAARGVWPRAPSRRAEWPRRPPEALPLLPAADAQGRRPLQPPPLRVVRQRVLLPVLGRPAARHEGALWEGAPAT